MSELHQLGVEADQAATLEAVSPEFLREGLLHARTESWRVLGEIRDRLTVGMTELEARKLALECFARQGVTKHWHQPYIRFGQGTCLTYENKLQPDYRLQDNDPIYLDLGPVWEQGRLSYEGDVGDSFVFGANPDYERCIEASRRIFQAARVEWSARKLTGEEIYRFVRAQASAEGYVLVEGVEGHRVSDFPHKRYSNSPLSKARFEPKAELWVLEVQLNHPEGRFGAFYEDLLL